MKKRPSCLGLAAALVAILTIYNPVASAAEKVLRFVPRGDLNILDPIWSTVAVTRNYGFMVYDMLFALDEKFQPQPQMLESFQISADGLIYSFVLRQGLKWHDGAPVTPADCITSINRWAKRNLLGQELAALTVSLVATGERSFSLTLKERFDVPNALAQPTGSPAFMMPEWIANTDANTQIKETIGSGPFIFKKEEWKPGSKEVFLRNPDYRPRQEPPSFLAGGKQVKVDRVEWIHMPDPATIMAALQSGEIDYYENPSADFLPIFERNAEIRILDLDPMGSQGTLRLNHLHPPFNDVRARQALLYAINREEYSRAVAGSPKYYWRDCFAYFGCGGPFESDSGAIKARDLNKAKELLKASGYAGEPVIVMDPTNVPVLHAAVTVTVNAMRSMGMNVDVQAMDVGTMIRRRASREPPAKGGWNVFHTQFQGIDVISPASNQYIAANCDKAPPGWPCDAEIEKLRIAFLKESDPGKQKIIAEQLHRRAYEVVPYIAVGQWKQPVAYRANVSGILPAAATVFWNIDKR